MNEKINQPQSLKQKWGTFLNIVLDPWVCALLVLTGILYYFLTNVNDGNIENKWVVTVITTIISLITGLLGGVIANKWAQLTEMKVLVARGKSAIRGLKLILLNVANIEKRTKDYIGNIDEENSEYKLIKSTYEEVIEKCNIVEEEIISAIENWTDIIPEVENFKTEIGLVSSLKTHQNTLICEIDKLQEDITKIQQTESEEKSKLEEKLNQKTKELDKTKSDLRNKEQELNKSIFSGLTSAPVSIGTSSYVSSKSQRICSSCGITFMDDGLLLHSNCPKCRGSHLSGGIKIG